MEKQKVCIIGGGLTGLITAITLSKLNLEIDLITGNVNQDKKSNRTTAISQNNYDFMKKLGVFKFSKNDFWPCSKMKLYTDVDKKEFDEIFELKKDDKQKKILYMIKNSIIKKQMISNIKKRKKIKLITQKIVYKILSSGLLKSVRLKSGNSKKYNLIIICTGSNSYLVKTLFSNHSFERSYKEVSFTTILAHNFIQNNVARQIFLNNEILAFLPISNTQTSIVWSVKKNKLNEHKNKNDSFFKKNIQLYSKHFLKNVKFITGIEYRNLNLLIRKKYYQDRALLFGDALHTVHPMAGQGFNMILRDLTTLERILKNKINLGLDIGGSEILSEISKEAQPRNFVYSMGIDFLKNCFSFQERSLKDFRNKIITKLNKNNFAKDILFNLADKGFKF